MKSKKYLIISIFLLLIFPMIFLNWKYKVIALHLLQSENCHFRVLTWNIYSSKIENKREQEKIARLIISQNADFVQLNEFSLDSCLVIDSLLSEHYPYREDVNAKVKAGDVFYSRKEFVESGKYSSTIPNCIFSKVYFEEDSLFIIGCHLPGNNHEGQIEIDDADSLRRVKTFWRHYQNAQEKRKEAVCNIKRTVQESSLPMIVMGDMNDFNASAPMDSLKDAGMKNAWWEGGLGYGATYHEGWLRLRIDHIYYNDKLKLEGVKVVNTDLSDHNILIADFSIVD